MPHLWNAQKAISYHGDPGVRRILCCLCSNGDTQCDISCNCDFHWYRRADTNGCHGRYNVCGAIEIGARRFKRTYASVILFHSIRWQFSGSYMRGSRVQSRVLGLGPKFLPSVPCQWHLSHISCNSVAESVSETHL